MSLHCGITTPHDAHDTPHGRCVGVPGSDPLTPEEVQAVQVLTQRGRILIVLLPEGIPTEDIQDLSRKVNRRLEWLTVQRDARRRMTDA